MARPALVWGIAALGIWGLGACAPVAPDPTTEPLPSHAIESPRLAELMQALEQLSRERLPQAMDLEEERSRRLDKVTRVAAAIAESAARLDDAVSELPLTPQERRLFAEHAEDLRHRAQTLAEQAHSLSSETIRDLVAGVEDTCAGCHQLFRAPRSGGDASIRGESGELGG